VQNWRQLFAESKNDFYFLVDSRFVRALVKQRAVCDPNHPDRQHETATEHRHEKFLIDRRLVLQQRNATAERQRRLAGALTTQAVDEVLLFDAEFDSLLALSFFAQQSGDCDQYDGGRLDLAPNRAIHDCKAGRQQNERSDQRVAKVGSCAESQCTIDEVYDLIYFPVSCVVEAGVFLLRGFSGVLA